MDGWPTEQLRLTHRLDERTISKHAMFYSGLYHDDRR